MHPGPWLLVLKLLLRLALYVALNLAEESIALMGPCCASWGIPARATSMRSYINIHGALHLPFVADANVTIARMLRQQIHIGSAWLYMPANHDLPRVTFLCLLLSARHCYYIVEHPMQSLICRHPRWEYFCNKQNWAP